jgi:hypothetical protein
VTQPETPSPVPAVAALEADGTPPVLPQSGRDLDEPLPPLPKRTVLTRVRDYFLGEDPSLLTALVPTCFLSMLLYTRHPATNFIFDEQEALLANPYVRAAADPMTKIGWLEAFKRDFWGLTPDRTIGSYRPLPDIVWRGMWKIGMRDASAFPHDYLNVLLHGLNGALLVILVFKWTRDRLTAWLAGGIFVATAVVTEAVSGVVGLADVLGGAGALMALLALNLRLPTMPIALFAATMFGLYSKESALCIVAMVPVAALLTAQLTHPERPLRWARAGVATVVVAIAFVFYVEMRRRWFPVATPHDLSIEANADKPPIHRAFAAALRWYAQPMLPHDPLNNPLIEASPPYRIAGALRVYARGIGQVLFPMTLSGDYSAPQEPVPDELVFPESIVGALAMVVPFVAAPVVGIASWWRWRRTRALDLAPVVVFALVWIVVSYFPVSNIPVVLPTVRAERFWYFPAIGTATVLGIVFTKLFALGRRVGAPPRVSSRSSSASSASLPGATRSTTTTTSTSGTRPARPSPAAPRRTSTTRSCWGRGVTSRGASPRTTSPCTSPRSGPWPASTRATRSAGCTSPRRRCRTTCAASSSARMISASLRWGFSVSGTSTRSATRTRPRAPTCKIWPTSTPGRGSSTWSTTPSRTARSTRA